MRDRQALLAWLEDPPYDRGIRFAGRGEAWDFWSYERLAALTRRLAAGLAGYGVRAGDAVAVVQRSSPDFVASLFAAMLVGAAPVPIAPPMSFQDGAEYAEHLTGLLATAKPAVVLADEDLVAKIAAPHVSSVSSLLDNTSEDQVAWPDSDIALLQFTSGSTGRARGVRVPYRALAANVEAIREWLEWTEQDPVASWLPVHHDMGLIGCLICPVVSKSDLWLLPPEEFVRNPLRYLRCFGESGARLTATPTFGLDYIVRRVDPDRLAGLDFSEWRAVIVGAEHIDAASLDRFYRLLRAFGLRRSALLPAYGLAEATLAVTGLPLREEWSAVGVPPDKIALDAPVPVDPQNPTTIVGCGRPLSTRVEIHGADAKPLPDGWVGEIVVSGDSVARGYVGDGSPVTRFTHDRLYTGDAGFVHDGQLFLLGRLGDSLKLRGRAVFAEDVEAAVKQCGVPAHRMAAVLGWHENSPTVVLVFDGPQPGWVVVAREAVLRRTEGARVVVIDAPIPRTSSGKVKRRALWRAFTAGTLTEGGLGGRN